MVRMPDEQDLSRASIRSPAVISAPRDFVGPALRRAGETIEQESLANRELELRQGRQAEAENDALDLARARADWNTRRLTEEDGYQIDKAPDYSKWEQAYSGNIEKHRTAAGALIKNPKVREKFNLETQDDVTVGTLRVRGRAGELDRGKRAVEGLASVEDNLAAATKPGIPQEEADKIIAQARADIDNLAEAGLLTPAEAIERRRAFMHNYAAFKYQQHIEDDPAGAYNALTKKTVYDIPIVTKKQAGRSSSPSLTGVNPDLIAAFKATQNQFGRAVPIVSALRDEETNRRVGGAKKSQHLHGNAFDVDVSGLSKAERRRLIETASANGITGIGVYANSLHFDMGQRRVWGASYGAKSVPAWAYSATAKHMAGAVPKERGGSLIDRLIHQESRNNPDAISPKGAVGLMQVMPGTALDISRELGDANFPDPADNSAVVAYLKNPKVNRRYGEYYLKKMLERYDGDEELALVAYNAGPGVADRYKSSGDRSVLPAETRDYVQKIMGGGEARVAAAPDYDQFLKPDDRLRLAGIAEAEWGRRKQIEKETTALDRYKVRAAADNDIAQIETTGKATDLTQEQVAETLGEDDAAKWLDARKSASSLYGAVSTMTTMPTDAIGTYVDGLKPQPGAADFESAQKVYEAAAQRAEQLKTAREKDPAGYVLQFMAPVKQAWEEFKPDDPATARAAIAATIDAQVQLGIDNPQPLPMPQAKEFAARIMDESQPPDARIETIASIVRQTPDVRQQEQIIRQLAKAGASPKIANVMEAYQRQDTGAARRLFQAAMIEPSKVPNLGSEENKLGPAVEDAMIGPGSIGQVFYGLEFGDPRNAEVAQSDIELAKSAAKLALGGGMDQESAIAQAVKDIFGPVEKIDTTLSSGAKVLGLVDTDQDRAKLLGGLEVASGKLIDVIDGYNATAFGKIPKGASPDIKAAFRAAHEYEKSRLLSDGVWRNYGAGWAFFDPVNQSFLADQDGKPVTFTTPELMKMGEAVPAPAPAPGYVVPDVPPAFSEGIGSSEEPPLPPVIDEMFSPQVENEPAAPGYVVPDVPPAFSEGLGSVDRADLPKAEPNADNNPDLPGLGSRADPIDASKLGEGQRFVVPEGAFVRDKNGKLWRKVDGELEEVPK